MICKICGNNTEIYGVCDFNKNCEERNNFYLPLMGEPVYYHRCNHCGCIQTNYCDNWTSADYNEKIYNDDYILVDPEWKFIRPAANAEIVNKIFFPCSVVDFGGGDGQFAANLRNFGFESTSYDPYFNNVRIDTKVDLVTCFEVFEHTPTPHNTIKECLSFLKEDGILFFSTLPVDFLKPRAMDAAADASYISPRNGHITIHTRKSIELLCEKHNLEILFDDGRFFAVKYKTSDINNLKFIRLTKSIVKENYRVKLLESLVQSHRQFLPDKKSKQFNYFVGMLNGLICAHATVTGHAPKYISFKHANYKKIRHKLK